MQKQKVTREELVEMIEDGSDGTNVDVGDATDMLGFGTNSAYFDQDLSGAKAVPYEEYKKFLHDLRNGRIVLSSADIDVVLG